MLSCLYYVPNFPVAKKFPNSFNGICWQWWGKYTSKISAQTRVGTWWSRFWYFTLFAINLSTIFFNVFSKNWYFTPTIPKKDYRPFYFSKFHAQILFLNCEFFIFYFNRLMWLPLHKLYAVKESLIVKVSIILKMIHFHERKIIATLLLKIKNWILKPKYKHFVLIILDKY